MAHDCAKHLLPSFGFGWCYAELKDRLAAGTPLSRKELDFIGSYEQCRSTGGWRSAGEIATLQALDEGDADPDPADAGVLHSLISIGSQETLEFLA